MPEAQLPLDSPLLIALSLHYDYMYTSKHGTKRYGTQCNGTHMDAFALLLPTNALHADVVQIFAAELQGPEDAPIKTSFDKRWRLDDIQGRRAIHIEFLLQPFKTRHIPIAASHDAAKKFVNELALQAAERCAASAGAFGMIRARDMQEPQTLSIGLSRAFDRLISGHEKLIMSQNTPVPTARRALPPRKGL